MLEMRRGKERDRTEGKRYWRRTRTNQVAGMGQNSEVREGKKSGQGEVSL